jgi:uncharacterized membrane protein
VSIELSYVYLYRDIMQSQPPSGAHNVRRHVRLMFWAGLVFAIPIAATSLVLYGLFRLIDEASEPFIRATVGHSIPGVGFVLTLLLLYLIGVVTSHFIGRRLAEVVNNVLSSLPGVSFFYLSLRQLGKALTDPASPALKRVVYLPYPSPRMKTIGVVTCAPSVGGLGNLIGVYVPTPPNPTTGFLIFMPEQTVTETGFSFEEGMKISFSAGLYWPDKPHVSDKKPASDKMQNP